MHDQRLYSGGFNAVRREWRNYNDSMFRWEVIGVCAAKAHGPMSFKMALEEVRQNQPHTQNSLPFEAARFRRAVSRAMEIPENSDLELCTAADSALDEFHGVDGFFYYGGKWVTFDFAMNINERRHRTHVVVTRKDAFEHGYAMSAVRVADRFRRFLSSPGKEENPRDHLRDQVCSL